MGLFDTSDSRMEEVLARLERIEDKLDRLLAQGGAAPSADMGDLKSECLALVRAGRKIQAIKRWREVTGQGLAEAKQAVEAL
jgi:ribosomal protein L7/L12